MSPKRRPRPTLTHRRFPLPPYRGPFTWEEMSSGITMEGFALIVDSEWLPYPVLYHEYEYCRLVGRIPKGMLVHQTCIDPPGCCDVDHLILVKEEE